MALGRAASLHIARRRQTLLAFAVRSDPLWGHVAKRAGQWRGPECEQPGSDHAAKHRRASLKSAHRSLVVNFLRWMRLFAIGQRRIGLVQPTNPWSGTTIAVNGRGEGSPDCRWEGTKLARLPSRPSFINCRRFGLRDGRGTALRRRRAVHGSFARGCRRARRARPREPTWRSRPTALSIGVAWACIVIPWVPRRHCAAKQHEGKRLHCTSPPSFARRHTCALLDTIHGVSQAPIDYSLERPQWKHHTTHLRNHTRTLNFLQVHRPHHQQPAAA